MLSSLPAKRKVEKFEQKDVGNKERSKEIKNKKNC